MGALVVAQRARGIDPWSSGIGGVIGINLLITFTDPRASRSAVTSAASPAGS